MIKQKKQAIKRLLVTAQAYGKRLPEKSVHAHLGHSRFTFLKWVIRFQLEHIVHAEECLIKDDFDQSELLMSAECGSGFYWGIWLCEKVGKPHSFVKDTRKHLEDYAERFFDLKPKIEE
jgi:hypothetical protein